MRTLGRVVLLLLLLLIVVLVGHDGERCGWVVRLRREEAADSPQNYKAMTAWPERAAARATRGATARASSASVELTRFFSCFLPACTA